MYKRIDWLIIAISCQRDLSTNSEFSHIFFKFKQFLQFILFVCWSDCWSILIYKSFRSSSQLEQDSCICNLHFTRHFTKISKIMVVICKWPHFPCRSLNRTNKSVNMKRQQFRQSCISKRYVKYRICADQLPSINCQILENYVVTIQIQIQ